MAVIKMEFFFARWLSLFAGEDTEHIPFILERAHELLFAIRRRKRAVPTPSQVARVIQQAYQERLDTQVEAQVLRRYNFTAKSFQAEGKKRCTASVYNNLCAEIANVKLSLRFLLAGFDDKNKGHIIVGGGEDAPTDYTPLGFMAIGTGAHAALSSLMYHRERQHISASVSESQCLYVTAAAKFMAESARDVGKHTNIAVISTEQVRVVTGERKIRKVWEGEGAPRLPVDLESRLGPLIVTPDEGVRQAQAALDEFTRSNSQKLRDQR